MMLAVVITTTAMTSIGKKAATTEDDLYGRRRRRRRGVSTTCLDDHVLGCLATFQSVSGSWNAAAALGQNCSGVEPGSAEKFSLAFRTGRSQLQQRHHCLLDVGFFTKSDPEP